ILSLSALVISEDRTVHQALQRLLALAGIASADSTASPSAILLGCRAHIAKNDLAAAQAMARNGHRIPIILVTSHGSEDLAIEALRAGIANYLRLPLTAAQLISAIHGVAPTEGTCGSMDRILGVSAAIQSVKAQIFRIAACSSNVLITGET